MKIGFVGLGVMGMPLAKRLLQGGHNLSVFANDPARASSFASSATVVSTPREVAAASDLVITMVRDTADVEAVLFGDNGVSQAIKPGSTIIDMSTISPLGAADIARRLSSIGCYMLDAPVSGGELGAIEGKLSIMVGGDRGVYEKHLSILQLMGKKIVYAGPSGSGQKTKAVNQVIVALNLLAMVEGLRVAEAGGLDLQTTLDAVTGGAGSSWALANLAPKILAGDFAPGFQIRLQQKDLRLATEWIEDLKLDAPGTRLTYSLFTEALENGLGMESTHALIKLWDKRRAASVNAKELSEIAHLKSR